MISKVLSIAGTDPSGGAGAQADIKTITAFKCYALSVITALVAQNTIGVKSILDIPLDFISNQIDCVFQDIKVDSIKIGMLHKPDIVNLVSQKIINNFSDCSLVIDPVMVAKSGDDLLTEEARKSLINNLIPHATIVTPNIPEAEIISNMRIRTEKEIIKAGMLILSMGPSAVLMKGGHSNSEIVKDYLIQENNIDIFEAIRINTNNTHGTGCTLSAAIASGLSKGNEIKKSVAIAHEYVNKAIKNAPGIGRGFGPLNHVHSIEPLI
ncbi:MAG: Hydroxymethylpyrimidine/phosphomethylpyrimidine kinase [Alphaproteobacteria bacterium MarineAlpha2_Bin1]|nr:MAG: Hydroxymethylpyrimidine/phosphomethylpyrimidine kinase [Alphaproteobacteria bacterium MarineAlpha2_Bin1]